jgi:hypothetical protein
MYGKVIRTETCPKCQANGKDSRGDNLVVYSDGGYHCFACHYHRSAKFYIPKEETLNVKKHLLPADFTRDVPAEALKWLLQYGLPYSYWKDQIGYSRNENRLIFTVGNPIQFSIGRLIPSEDFSESALRGREWRVSVGGTDGRDGRPPQQNGGSGSKRSKKWFVWGDCHKHCELVRNEASGELAGGIIVLVEDLISAHKVGQVTTAIPLFGTKIHPCHLYYLINENKPVVLWLDKDQELNVKKQAWQLESVINQPVQIVVTDKDPKKLTYKEIYDSICLPKV